MKIIIHKFVEQIPEDLKDGVIYISISYGTTIHKCCCGCGKEVVTPLSPTDWQLIFNGDSISLYPSIGNWNFDCKSHYWIWNNRIEWARKWSEKEINAGRHKDHFEKIKYYRNKIQAPSNDSKKIEEESKGDSLKTKHYFWAKIEKWWLKRKSQS